MLTVPVSTVTGVSSGSGSVRVLAGGHHDHGCHHGRRSGSGPGAGRGRADRRAGRRARRPHDGAADEHRLPAPDDGRSHRPHQAGRPRRGPGRRTPGLSRRAERQAVCAPSVTADACAGAGNPDAVVGVPPIGSAPVDMQSPTDVHIATLKGGVRSLDCMSVGTGDPSSAEPSARWVAPELLGVVRSVSATGCRFPGSAGLRNWSSPRRRWSPGCVRRVCWRTCTRRRDQRRRRVTHQVPPSWPRPRR